MSSHKKRPLEAVAPEQEAARSPRKRLRRTVLVMMWLERRRSARAATVEEMAQVVRQLMNGPGDFLSPLHISILNSLLQGLLAEQLGSLLPNILRGLLAEQLGVLLPNILRGLLADQLGAFQRTVMASIVDTTRPVLFRTEIQERQAASLPNVVYERSRSVMGSIGGTVRSDLRTEMHEPQAALLPNGGYEPSRDISVGLPETGGISGVVKLLFVDADRPKNTLYTGFPVKWQNGKKAKVAIFENERQIKKGNLSKLQIEILPVHAEFFSERGLEGFTQEEFNKHIHMYKGKESVLTTVNLRNGEAYLGSFSFTESSHRKNLRLAARVKRPNPANRVQEAITEPFVIKDRRSELNEKSVLPSKEDAVHRLNKISQKGKRCGVLAGENITTVKQLLRYYHKDKSGLQKLTGMKERDWSIMIKHATMCDPGDEIYSYRVAVENCELLFNDFYNLDGMMINGSYVPVRDLDQFQQLKANNWKISAYKKFYERENSVGLTPDYFMSNGLPVREERLNNDAGPSVQASTAWQYANDMAAQQEFGEQHPFRQQNGFPLAEVLSNNDAGPSKQEAPRFSQHTAYTDLGQHGPSMPHNGTPYCHLAQGNILNGQGSLSAQPTILSHPLVQEDVLITGARVTAPHTLYLSSSTIDAPGTSLPLADGFSLRTSSRNDVQADDLSWLPQVEEWLATEPHGADQLGFATSNELPHSNNQFDGGNQ